MAVCDKGWWEAVGKRKTGLRESVGKRDGEQVHILSLSLCWFLSSSLLTDTTITCFSVPDTGKKRTFFISAQVGNSHHAAARLTTHILGPVSLPELAVRVLCFREDSRLFSGTPFPPCPAPPSVTPSSSVRPPLHGNRSLPGLSPIVHSPSLPWPVALSVSPTLE